VTTDRTDDGGTSVDNAQKPYDRSEPLSGISSVNNPHSDRAALRPMDSETDGR